MRTPQSAYEEAMRVITQRLQHPNVTSELSGYKLGLQIAIEQLRMSFHGVFPEAQSPPPEEYNGADLYDNPPPINSPLNRELRVAYMNNQPHPILEAFKEEVMSQGGIKEDYRQMAEEALGLRPIIPPKEFVSTQPEDQLLFADPGLQDFFAMK